MSRKKKPLLTPAQIVALFVDVLLPLASAAIVPMLQAKVAAMMAPPPGARGSKKLFVAAIVFGYAVFVAVSVLFVKLAWRWIL